MAVDARLMLNHPRGMGQFARALVTPLAQTLTALLPGNQHTQDWPHLSAGTSFFPWWEQFVLPRLAKQCGATHLLCPSNTGPVQRTSGLRTVLVVHDLIFLQPLSELPTSRSSYQNLGRLYRRTVVPKVIRHADVLITVSQFTRNELNERFGVPLEHVHVIPNTLHEDWFVGAPLADAHRCHDILCVTGEGPSKNLSALLRAFAQMQLNGIGRGMRLRVVGVKTVFHASYLAEARVLGIGDALLLEGFVSESDLRQMYRKAWLFVLPSLFEGFGIPLIEAMASGTPVACSNTTSMPEVAGAGAWLFDPRNVKSITEGLTAAVLASDRLERAAVGLVHARQFAHGKVMGQIDNFWRNIE